jgi:hypothetical protein
LILQALLRPAPEGIVKDEGIPPSFLEVLTSGPMPCRFVFRRLWQRIHTAAFVSGKAAEILFNHLMLQWFGLGVRSCSPPPRRRKSPAATTAKSSASTPARNFPAVQGAPAVSTRFRQAGEPGQADGIERVIGNKGRPPTHGDWRTTGTFVRIPDGP